MSEIPTIPTIDDLSEEEIRDLEKSYLEYFKSLDDFECNLASKKYSNILGKYVYEFNMELHSIIIEWLEQRYNITFSDIDDWKRFVNNRLQTYHNHGANMDYIILKPNNETIVSYKLEFVDNVDGNPSVSCTSITFF